MQNNKKLLAGALGGVLVVALAVILFLFVFKSNPIQGKWVPEDATADATGTMEFTKDKMILDAEFKEDGKSLKMNLTADYKIKEQKGDIYTLETSNLKTDVKTEGFSDEEKKLAEEFLVKGLKEEFESNKEAQFKLSSDKKQLIEIKDGKEGTKYNKK